MFFRNDEPRIGNVAIDCNDLRLMSAFWGALTGMEVLVNDEPRALLLGDPADLATTKLFMQQVEEPRVGKNRLHIDLYVTDRNEAIAEVERLGGSRVDEHSNLGIPWVVAADPEGNQFCLVEVLGNPRAHAE